MIKNKPIIVILEDQIERIEWIQERFGDVADIHWKWTVNEFFEELNSVDRSLLSLIILDHDLGGTPRNPIVKGSGTSLKASGHWPLDENGQTGMHAVDNLDAWKDVPTLVWSVNGGAAPVMVSTLKKKGFATGWLPFKGVWWPKLKLVIRSAIAKN